LAKNDKVFNKEMTRFFVALCCALILFACKPEVPKDIIKPEEMEKILYDIHLVDGYVNYIPTPDSAKKVSAPYFTGIFKKYGIDSATHARSMAYYYKNPDQFLKIYENIGKRLANAKTKVSELAVKEAKLEEAKVKKQEIKKLDSSKKLDVLKKVDSIRTVKGIKKPIE
jgi:hypothetical protein